MFAQIVALTSLNLQELRHRLRASSVMVIGVAAAVAALISLLALGAGLRAMALQGVDAGAVIVLSGGAASEASSNLEQAAVTQIVDTPGTAKAADGSPLAQPMAVVSVDVMQRKDGVIDNVLLRGTGPNGLAMVKGFHLVAGRMYRAGAYELVVGRKAEAQFEGLELGGTVSLRGVPWKVVGIFAGDAPWTEGDLLADAPTVMSAFNQTGYQSVELQLAKPSDFRRFDDALSVNPQLSVIARPYRAFLTEQTSQLIRVLNFVAYFVGIVMAVGAVFGAVNTLYSAVEARTREIATLRALGFGSGAVIVSVLAEALVLALPGAAIGGAVAWLLFNGQPAAMYGVTFSASVTPGLVMLGLVVALAIGAIGAFPPAIRAARLPIAAALKST